MTRVGLQRHKKKIIYIFTHWQLRRRFSVHLMNFKHIVMRPETLNHSSVQKQDRVTQFHYQRLERAASKVLMAWFPERNKAPAAWCMLLRDLMTCCEYENKLALQFVSSADIADLGLPRVGPKIPCSATSLLKACN